MADNETKLNIGRSPKMDDIADLVSLPTSTVVFISAYLFFLGTTYSYYYYSTFGISSASTGASVNALLVNAYYPLSEALPPHSAESWVFVAAAPLLILVVSLRPRWRFGQILIRILAIGLIILLFQSSVGMAKEAGNKAARQRIGDIRNPVCVRLKKDFFQDAPVLPDFNENPRCALAVVAETPDVLYLLDLKQLPAGGRPGKVFAIRRDLVELIETSYF
jgi:hypothetical protein